VTSWTLYVSTAFCLVALAFAAPLSRLILVHEDATLMSIGIFGLVMAPMFVRGTMGAVMTMALGLALMGLTYGPLGTVLSELFPTSVRYTGSSLAYTIAGVFGGAVAPLVFTALLSSWGSWVPVALYLLVAGLVTLAGLALGRNPDPAEDEAYLVQYAASVTPPGTAAR